MAVKEIKKSCRSWSRSDGSYHCRSSGQRGYPGSADGYRPPGAYPPDEKKKGLTLDSPAVRNRLSNAGKEGLIKKKPGPPMNPLYKTLPPN